MVKFGSLILTALVLAQCVCVDMVLKEAYARGLPMGDDEVLCISKENAAPKF